MNHPVADDRRQPWLKWFPSDWRSDPKLRGCSLAARGLWVDLIGLMHEAIPYGHLLINGRKPSAIELARQVGSTAKEVSSALDELKLYDVFSVDTEGVIYSRRMVRTAKRSETNIANGLNGGNPNWRRGDVPKAERVGPLSANTKRKLMPRLWAECGGKCKLCGVDLDITNGDAPNFAHVDHIVARCDGGTHDPSNLRLLCRYCNHARKNVGHVETSDETRNGPTVEQTDEVTEPANARTNARTNTQRPEARGQNPQPPAGALCPDDAAESAGEFLRQYPTLYSKCRSGARYVVKDARDFPVAVELVTNYGPLPRLLEMLEVFLLRKDTGEMGKPGSPRQFAHLAPDCDRLLRENGR